MSYTVVWTPGAENDLASIWLAAPDRKAVTEAVDRIETRLRSNAEEAGESRGGDDRIDFAEPLAVIFEVRAADRVACVLGVWRTK